MLTAAAGRLVRWILALAVIGQGSAQASEEPGPQAPPVRDTAKANSPSPSQLADQLLEAYRRVECISFDATVLQEGLTEEGEVRPRKEVAWARVQMRGAKLRMQVFRCHGGEHLFDFIDDGKNLIELTARQRMETPVPPVTEGRNLYLSESVGFDACLVGHLMESWLAPNPSRSNTLAWAPGNVRTGHYLGIEEVDGQPCHIVRFRVGPPPGPESVLADFTLYFDAKRFWIRKRVGFQRAFNKDGDILQLVRRTVLYRDISVDPVPDDAFVAPLAVLDEDHAAAYGQGEGAGSITEGSTTRPVADGPN